MIVDLPSTTTVAISKKLVALRQDTGAMALGRVLTLLIVVDEQDAEEAIQAANDASRQHPCRIIAVVIGNKRGQSRIDAQIRVGGDAGASEVVVLRLYGALTDHGRSVVIPLLLPDSPVVAWWPTDAPTHVAQDPIGSMAQRRITDAAASKNPRATLKSRAEAYTRGDTDLAWTRVTLWRGLLAAALDQPPFEPVTEATVTGGSDSPSTDLLAGWLAQTLRCPVRRARSRAGTGMVSVRFERRSGAIDLVRPDGAIATLTQPGQPVRRISLARRATAECLADELRRLDPDEIYEETIRSGLARVGTKTVTASEAVRDGAAPSVEEAERESRRIARSTSTASSAEMVKVPPLAPKGDTAVVKQAAARKLAKANSTGTTARAKAAAKQGTAPTTSPRGAAGKSPSQGSSNNPSKSPSKSPAKSPATSPAAGAAKGAATKDPATKGGKA